MALVITMSSYIITIGDTPININVLSYSPSIPAEISKLPEDCFPADPGEISWEADTGNDGLDDYINSAPDIIEYIEEELVIAIEEERTNQREEAAEARADELRDSDFMELYF